MDSYENEQSAAHVTDYLTMLWHRKWLILFVFVALSAVGLYSVYKVLKPKYQSQSKIEIARLRGPVEDRGGLSGETFYQTQYVKIGSLEVAAVAAVKLGLSQSREIARDDGSADMIQHAISISPERDTRVVRISSKQGDAQLAADIVNAVVDAYIEVTHQQESERAGKFQNDLQGRIVQLQVQLDAKRKALDEFEKDRDLQRQLQEQTVVTTRLSALSEAQLTARVNREQAEKIYADLKTRYDADDNIADTVVSSYSDQLKIRIKELEQSRRLMEKGKTARGLATDPAYQQTVALIAEYQRDYDETMKKAQSEANASVLERARINLDNTRQVETLLVAEMASMRTTLEQLAGGLTALSRYNELKKELENIQKWYDQMQQSLMEAKISNDFPMLEITINEVARRAKQPAWPNKTQLAIVSVAMSLVLSLGLAFFLDYMDRTVRKPEDVEQELRMPLVGFVPSMSSSHSNGRQRGRVVIDSPTSGPAESYRKIRAKLFVYKKESHAKVFAITSTTAGEGKTTLASNLAIAFAQAGANTLLVDADMRHPMLQNTFGVDRDPGLGNYLDGKCTWESATLPSNVAKLSLLPCGAGGDRSAELVESPRLKDFLTQAREQYDVVVLDTPPVLGVADSTVLCNVSDATLFVIQASRNPKWLVKRAKMEVEAAGAYIVGVVLNRVRSRRGEYYYYHRYYPKKA